MTHDQTLSRREIKAEKVKKAREWVREQFPVVFKGDEGRPLAIGVHKLLYDKARAEEGPPAWAIRTVLAKWTRHPRYLAAVAAQKPRHHLDGTIAGEVTDQQATFAHEQLKKWHRERKAKQQKGELPNAESQKEGADKSTVTEEEKPKPNWGGTLRLKKTKE
ncbi:hypothetical protein CKO15_12895 [Halorhodospira abdelmalekii]|uniref:ProQ/FINO family protein n=1 Tax=Halorhodospira abdelmalekii TaxID=421629 RepID=UPI001907829B|nr:ProQ/FINO family protein [Halorhodospira abdelmalekii]MBK1736152.1 hypothetical protein [Halorhodospira abdelmalekii]